MSAIQGALKAAPAAPNTWERQALEALAMAQSTIKNMVTVTEAGAKGGATVMRKHGTEHYRQIGRKGGLATQAVHGPEYYKKIGERGGKANAKKGAEYYQAIAKKGGARVRELIELAKAASEAQKR